jgi:DNA methylase
VPFEYLDTRTVLRHGDCRDVLRVLPDDYVHAVVTDPPYDLTSGKGGGFLGRGWDSTGIAFDPSMWAAVLRVLKPGGHLLAFGGTRKWHRLAVAVEDAGFEIRDSIAWLSAQGWPKAKGHLKPAFEPVVVARKPLIGTVAENVAAHGTGALNIEACRIGTDESTVRTGRAEIGYHGGSLAASYTTGSTAGRWPANVALDEAMAGELDAQVGVRKSGKMMPTKVAGERAVYGRDAAAGYTTMETYGDSGGASRFFYCAKAPASERPSYVSADGKTVQHSTVKPLTLMCWLVRLVTPPNGIVLDPFAGSGTTLEAASKEGFRSIGIERWGEYLPLIRSRFAA